MARTKFKFSYKGYRQLMKSEGMASVVNAHGAKVLSRLSGDYSLDPYDGRNRRNAAVKCESYEAYLDCLHNNTLLKALGGGE